MSNYRHSKLRKDGFQALIDGIEESHRNAQSQRTSNSGSKFISSGAVDDDGFPTGEGTLVGAASTNGGIAPWVNDTVAPGKPTGLSATSSASMIFIQWDGGLEGGRPADFDHISIYVDGVEIGVLSNSGTVTAGPYAGGSSHRVEADSWDNAHDSGGNPKPNGSERVSLPDVVANDADIDPDRLGITITKTTTPPVGEGTHTGDLWLQYGEGWGENLIADSKGADFANKWGYNGNSGTTAIGTGDVPTWIRTRPRANAWSELLYKTPTPVLHNGDVVSIKVKVNGETFDNNTAKLYVGLKNIRTDHNDIFEVGDIVNGAWTNKETNVTISGASESGDQYCFMATVLNNANNTNSVLLFVDFDMRVESQNALAGEWWWNGTSWARIPIAFYLDQLAVRNVQMDTAVIGALSAGIIKSGSFVTSDGLIGFDSSGFWAKNNRGDVLFKANQNGIQATGGFQTAASGNRIIMSQTLVDGTSIGGIQGQDSSDTGNPNWFIWGYGTRSSKDGNPKIQIGVNPQQPEITAALLGAGTTLVSLSGSKVELAGTQNSIFGNISHNGIDLYRTVPRRMFLWSSPWTGTPGGGWYTEKTETMVVGSPGTGKWVNISIGARVQGPGEYAVRLRLMIGNSLEYQFALMTPKNDGADNYTMSGMYFIRNGTYTVYVQTTPYGSVTIDGNPELNFVEPTMYPGHFNRYLTITEV